MLRKWLIGGIAVVALAAVGIAVARRERKPPPQPVATSLSPQVSEVNFVGVVQPRSTVAVAAPAAGVIDTYYVEVGQPVYQGQLLGKLRNGPLDDAQKKAQVDLDQAQAQIANLNSAVLAAKVEISRATADQVRAHNDVDRFEKEYNRQKKFWDQGITPRLTYEKAEKDFQAAKAEVDRQDDAVTTAKNRLAELNKQLDAANQQIGQSNAALENAKTQAAGSELHSPADGLVVARRGQPGDTVDTTVQDLFKIGTDLTNLEVDATPDPEILARLHAGQTVSVRVPDLSPDEIPAVVREVRGLQVIIDFTSPVPLQKLDLPAQVRIKF